MPRPLSLLAPLVVPALGFAASAALCAAPARAGSDYVNFEGATTHPIALSPDGSRLFVLNVPDARLEVYELSLPAEPVLLRTIPVGIEPVSLAVRSSDECWVVNTVSDSLSIVSVRKGRVVETIRTGDEPADLVFAGSPERAFVTCAAEDRVQVFDAATHAEVGSVAIFGKDPRAMAVSGSGANATVHVLVKRSGNGTTVIPAELAPPPPPPTGGGLPPAPQTGLVVAADDPAWSAQIPYTLPDVDLVELDASTLAITREVSGVGTNLYDLAVHPTTGEVWVVQTEARNLVRFENALRGHAVDHVVSVVGTGQSPTITKIDLNPGVDYSQLPNLVSLASSLADPAAILIDPVLDRVYVAAQGTERLGILNGAGAITDRIEIGETPGIFVQARAKRGPRGFALHPSAPWLYVYNRLQNSFTLFQTQAKAKGLEVKLGYNPTPQDVHLGRKYLYDAKLSGNGLLSCAGCHVDGEHDGLAWELGVTDGALEAPPVQPFPFDQANNPLVDFHPMKGPMRTQILRGLGGLAPYHWRGDRPDLDSFNGTFTGVLAGDAQSQAAMDLTVAWLDTVAFHPNPRRALDDSLSSVPAGASQLEGEAAFEQDVGGGLSCAGCHALDNGGSNGMVIRASFLQAAQQMKVPQLRDLYRKVGFTSSAGPSKAGFGFQHDGAVDTLADFLAHPQFDPWPASVKDELAEYLLAFDTGTKPIVGRQTTIFLANAASSAVTAELALLEARAAAGDCDAIVKGTLDGQQRGLVLDPQTHTWSADRADLGPYTTQALRDLVVARRAVWSFLAVPPGSGLRMGVDRDSDGLRDGEDAVLVSGTPDEGCNGAVHLEANLEPTVKTPGFALVVVNAPPSTSGLLVANALPTHVAGGPYTRLDLAPSSLVSWRVLTSDGEGFALARTPIPDQPALAGRTFVAKAFFPDACGGTIATEALRFTVQP